MEKYLLKICTNVLLFNGFDMLWPCFGNGNELEGHLFTSYAKVC